MAEEKALNSDEQKKLKGGIPYKKPGLVNLATSELCGTGNGGEGCGIGNNTGSCGTGNDAGGCATGNNAGGCATGNDAGSCSIGNTIPE